MLFQILENVGYWGGGGKDEKTKEALHKNLAKKFVVISYASYNLV